MKTEIFTSLAIALALSIASQLGLTVALGAHPWWAVKTGVVGSLGGLVAYAALRGLGLRPALVAGLAGIGLLAAGSAAAQGKAIFAASMAENSLAGRFWFFGWFAVMGAACVLLCGLATWALRR